MINMTKQVNEKNFMSLIPALKDYFTAKADYFKAGRLVSFLKNWKEITSDPEILSMVRGQHIKFNSMPIQGKTPGQSVKNSEVNIIDLEICKLIKKGCYSTHWAREGTISVTYIHQAQKRWLSQVNPKPEAAQHEYKHFKMDTLKSAISMMRQNCYMASVDLKDAYYSVSIAESDQKYLKFKWSGNLYKFTCFPNGLSFFPRKFVILLHR